MERVVGKRELAEEEALSCRQKAKDTNKSLFYPICFTILFFIYIFFIRSWPDNVHILQACYKLLTVARKQGIQSFLAAENLQEIYYLVRLNLRSASHVIRLFTLKLLTCFDQQERTSSEDKVNYHNFTFSTRSMSCASFTPSQNNVTFGALHLSEIAGQKVSL